MDVDADSKDNDDVKVDEQLYSRQLYVIDHESFKKMRKSSVLIAGLNGLGAEIAKNVILAGVHSVALVDHSLVRVADLGSNFYCRPDAVGKLSRAQCSVAQLRSLNPSVETTAIVDQSRSLDSLIASKDYDIVVMVGYPLSDCVRCNKIAHDLGLRFICCDAAGVFGQVFVDFGPQFECTDLTGEPPANGMVVNISKAANGVVHVHEDERHGLEDGDFVRFEEVEGMTELNGAAPVAVKVTSPFSFEIGDTSALGDYTGHGLYFQAKRGAVFKFDALETVLAMPRDRLLPDFPATPLIAQSDFGKDPFEQHLFYLALQHFRSEHDGAWPSPTAPKEAAAVFARFEALCGEHGVARPAEAEDAEGFAKWRLRWSELARCSSAVIAPLSALLGGVVGQEVLKAASAKFTPLRQMMYYDAFECLPTDYGADRSGFAPAHCRYDDYRAVFGERVQRKVMASRLFLVGAGAIGCEMLKNWALMGVGCGDSGRVVVTDMDSISTSNLNRQFLFRRSDVDAAKSTTAVEAVRAMNGDLNIVAHQNRVGPDSEGVYDFAFWSGLDAVCNALDNVEARLFVDAQCVKHKKPLLESGTLGTKGNTQIVVPQLTESYGSTRDPEAKGVPICTLKNFPNRIEHTIQFARDDFEGEFKRIPLEINEFLRGGDAFLEELHRANPAEEVATLRAIAANLGPLRPHSFEECVFWARRKFEGDFAHRIKQLLFSFPRDAVTTEGAPFWSPPKRAPDAVVFDVDDALHFGFVAAAANLRAAMFGLKGSSDRAAIAESLSRCVVPEFTADAKMKIAATDEEEKQQAADDDLDYESELKKYREALPDRAQLGALRLRVAEFESDDDSNHHMAFVAAASNLRARNYRIAERSKHDVARIAANIIPAIATTTALVAGLISFEFYKLAQRAEGEKGDIGSFRNCYVNLALPLLTMSDPVPCAETVVFKKGSEWRYSLWDNIEIRGGAEWTVEDLLGYFDREWGCDLNMLSFGNAMLYAFYMDAVKLMKRRKMTLKALVEEVCGIEIGAAVKCLEFEVNVDYQSPPEDEDEDDEPMMPTVAVFL